MPTERYVQQDYLHDRFTVQANQRGELTEAQHETLSAAKGSLLSRLVNLLLLSMLPGLCIGGSLLLAFFRVHIVYIGLFFGVLAVLSLAVLSRGAIRIFQENARLQRDLAESEVQHGEGKLAYEENDYIAQIPGRKLILPYGRDGLMPAATYRFFYLPQSGTVVSAEEVEKPSREEARRALQGFLAQANRFPVEALEVNRAGRLTWPQALRLLPQIISGGLLALASGAVIGFAIYRILQPPTGATGVSFWLLCLASLGGIFLAFGVVFAGRPLADLITFRVEAVEGAGHRLSEYRGSRRDIAKGTGREAVTHFYEVAGKRFKVLERAYFALINDLPYRVYYAPHSQALVGIEPLPLENGSGETASTANL